MANCGFAQWFVTLFSTAALLATLGSASQAADAAGCGDAGGLRRFGGSSIVLCDKRDFAEYTLPTGASITYDFNTRKGVFEDSMRLDGRLIRNVYAGPMGASSAEVFRNYQGELLAKGYQLLFTAQQAEIGPAMASFFENMGPGTQIWGYSPDEARYAAAVKDDNGTRSYIALYIVEYQDGYEPKFSPQKGQVMIRLDALQVGRLADRMVVASAAEITKDLASDGRIALYGILFYWLS